MPAEWELQDAIQITWPSISTDWKDNLEQVEKCFLMISQLVCKYQNLIILYSPTRNPKKLFNSKELLNIYLIEANYNDTWTRDYAPISTVSNGISTLKDFTFNGWGNKYPSGLDNKLNLSLLRKGIYKNLSKVNFILEGGSIESNGNGIILTTKRCLLNSNRNKNYKFEEIENVLETELYAKKILWLENGVILGDDTDAHIDTLARFVNSDSIVYVKCFDNQNPNFESLNKMENELKKFVKLNQEPFHLIPVPLISVIENKENLPASYVNFLITNKQVLIPTYNHPEDEIVINIFKNIFPRKEIEPVYCGEIIKQKGSLHCLTMQLYANTISINLFNHEQS